MFTSKRQYDLNDAREYFEEHQWIGDYFDEGRRVSGQWFGWGAERLELASNDCADDFLKLCAKKHSVTGERLTERVKALRINHRGCRREWPLGLENNSRKCRDPRS